MRDSIYRSKYFGHRVRIVGHQQVAWRLKKQSATGNQDLDWYIFSHIKQTAVDIWIEDRKKEIRAL